MGFILSVAYFAISYLTPGALFGSLAQYHIQLILAVVTVFFSIPRILESSVLKAPQSLALLGLACAGFLATLVSQRWLGGAVQILIEFLSIILAFFLVCLNVHTRKRMRILVVVLFLVSLFIIARGAVDLASMSGSYGPPVDPETMSVDLQQWDAAHPYLFTMRNNEGQWIYRIRGLGIINDPNDLAQFLVCIVAMMFVFWHPKKMPRNIVLVIFPVLLLIIGIFLTHSRGALLALTAMALVAGRRKVGTVPAAILAGCFFVGALGLQFAGGRNISASAGGDRVSLWGEAIAVYRSHLFFGVGFHNLPDYTDSHLTAHNSVMVCASELGSFGFLCWSVFLFTSFSEASATSSAKKVHEGKPVAVEDVPFPRRIAPTESLEKTDINQLGQSFLLALVGYFIAGWFLSRAITITLFMLGGLSESAYQLALNRGMISQRPPLLKLLRQSAIMAVSLLIAMYVVVRILNLAR